MSSSTHWTGSVLYKKKGDNYKKEIPIYDTMRQSTGSLSRYNQTQQNPLLAVNGKIALGKVNLAVNSPNR